LSTPVCDIAARDVPAMESKAARACADERPTSVFSTSAESSLVPVCAMRMNASAASDWLAVVVTAVNGTSLRVSVR
jgi:hypothetical protein